MIRFLDNLNCGIMILPAIVFMITGILGSGVFILRYVFKLDARDPISFGMIAFVVGLDISGLLILGSGTLGFLSFFTIWGYLALVSFFFIWKYHSGIHYVIVFCRDNYVFLSILAIVMLIFLGPVLCYPYCWDEQSYQIAVPMRWMRHGTLEVFMDNPYSAFPSLPQFVFRAGLEMGGIFMPRLINLILYIISFLALYRIVTRIKSNKLNSIILVSAIISAPVFVNMMGEAYSEGFIVVNLMAVFLLPGALRRDILDSKSWILCGIFCGAVAAVKLTGAGMVLPIVLWLLYLGYRKGADQRKLVRLLIILGVVAGLFALPFYIRPWFYTGNPFYPFLSSIFGGTEADKYVDIFHYAMGDRYYGLRTLTSFFTGPFLVAVYDIYNHGYKALFDGIAMGWQFLLVLAIIIVGTYSGQKQKNLNPKVIAGLIMIVATYTIWFFTSQQTRFLMPVYFIMVIPAAYLLKSFPVRFTDILLGILLFNMVYSVAAANKNHFITAWRLASSQRNNVRFLQVSTDDPGYIEAMSYLAEETPDDSKVLLLLERRGLYVPRNYEIAAPYFQAKYLTPVPQTSDMVFEEIKKSGADYVLLGITRANLDHIADFDEENNRLTNLIGELEKSGKLKQVFQLSYFWIFKVNTL